jgi:arylsulfatase A-like enzyme
VSIPQNQGSSSWQGTGSSASDTRATVPDAVAIPRRSLRSSFYRPSAALRRALKQSVGDRQVALVGGEPKSRAAAAPSHCPGLSGLIGAAVAVGVASGFLELFVQWFQLEILHQVDWGTLMISRHAGWMVVVTTALLMPCMGVALMAPALAWAAWRRSRNAPIARLTWTWDLAGAILGTLLLLGPLQTIHGLHPVAPVAAALGTGIRFRRWLVWPTVAWQRGARRLGTFIIGLLPFYALAQWYTITSAPERAWSLAAAQAPNVLWIVIDTLRADHMSVYGYHRRTTPELEAWAKQGITFDMARSAAPWTLPSHVTMFTGLWPSQHGARVDRPYIGQSPTLAEYLRSRGYATAGIVANVRICNRAYGVGRGFDTYIDYPWNQEISLQAAINNSAFAGTLTELARRLLIPVPGRYPLAFRRRAWAIAAQARTWLDGVNRRNASLAAASRRPFFMFLNLMDVHGPFLPAATAAGQFGTEPGLTSKQAVPECGWIALHQWQQAVPEEQPRRRDELDAVSRRLADLYDECLLGMDAALGRFLGGLRDSGMLKNTWVVITADHGEHFGEHNMFGHGSSLYNELTHVPLIIIPPLGSGLSGHDSAASLRGRRVDVPVSTRNLAATIAELIDPAGLHPFPGRSLAAAWTSDPTANTDPVLSQLEEPSLRGQDFRTDDVTKVDSLIDDGHVLIDSHNQPPELYQLAADPQQERNLAADPAELARKERMLGKLNAIRAGLAQPAD